MPNIGKHFIDRLKSAGVRHVFGYPGHYVFPFYDQLSKEVELITTTSERNAGIAADAYARVNGIGCVVVTYCVGGFNILDSVACAYAEKSPVIVISGAPGMKERDPEFMPIHMVRSFECQHEVFERVTCANTVLRNPQMAGYEIDRVLDACKHKKQPVYIELPRDMVNTPIVYDAWSVGTPPSFASDEDIMAEALAESVEWINRARRPVILAGVEIARYGLGRQLTKFAERVNVPVATTILGKSVVNERHPLSLGVFCGPLANNSCAKQVEESDCLIMLGVEMTDISVGFLPRKVWKRNAILSTCDEMRVRSHSFHNVGFCDFANALMKANYTREPWKEAGEKDSIKYVPESDKKLTIQRFFDKINSVLTDQMAIIADVGDSMFGAAGITVNRNHFLSPAFYNSMGFAVPGALGLGVADSNIRPLVIVGDGAFQMNCNELSTIICRGLNPIVVVINNGGFLTERFFMDGNYNNIPNWNYHRLPDVYGGGEGDIVRTEGEFERAMGKALASKNVYIINAVVDKMDASPALKRVMENLAAKGGFKDK